MKVLMVEDDRALINRNYHEFEEGEEVTVPDWVGRSFKDKGTAVDPDSEEESSEEETFANPDERETKAPSKDLLAEVPDLPDSVEAERTTENSHWFQFRTPSGDLVQNEDGDPFKVPGSEKRDTVLQLINEA